MTTTITDIKKLARRLMWSAHAIDLIDNTATDSDMEFLHHAMVTELGCREDARKARYRRQAGFPVIKTFTGYDWAHLSLPPALSRDDLETCRFIDRCQNLVLFGPVGTGKTHLGIAIGQAACARDIPVKYHTISDLVIRLTEAQRAGTLDKVLASINKAKLIILDEFGYVPIDRDAARLVFKIISDAYETRSVIITTNVAFSHWGSVLTDDQMAAAIIDRIAHHGHLLTFSGQSWRMTHALMKTTKKDSPK